MATTLNRRTRVLSYCPDLGVGVVEGRSYLGRATAAVVRWANGTVGAWDDDMLVAVEAGTVLAEDEGNNVGRLCNVRGDGAAGERARCWRVLARGGCRERPALPGGAPGHQRRARGGPPGHDQPVLSGSPLWTRSPGAGRHTGPHVCHPVGGTTHLAKVAKWTPSQAPPDTPGAHP